MILKLGRLACVVFILFVQVHQTVTLSNNGYSLFQESEKSICSEVEFTLEGKKMMKAKNEEPQCIELSNNLTQRTDRDTEQDGVLSVSGSDETKSNSTKQFSTVKDTETDFTGNGQIKTCSANSPRSYSPQSNLEHLGSKTSGLNSDHSNCGESSSVEKVISVEGLENSEESEPSVKADGHSCALIQTAKDITVNSGVSINGHERKPKSKERLHGRGS